jgi:hypothetical protein
LKFNCLSQKYIILIYSSGKKNVHIKKNGSNNFTRKGSKIEGYR